MPNAKGGKKFKKGKKQSFNEKALIYKDPKEDQEYGKIMRAMGNGRFEIQCFDGKLRTGILAGNMRKRVWVNKDDIILFSKWEFTTDDDKCSIIHKYDIDEAKRLQREGEFPDTVNLDEENSFNTDNDFKFDYDTGSDDSDGEKEEDKPWWKSKEDNKKDNDIDVWDTEKIDLDDI
jgi:translation initiation factor 1A